MALLNYFLLVTLLATHAKAVAVVTCTAGGTECSDSGGIGDTCELLTDDGTTRECNCQDGFVRVGDECLANVDACTDNAECAALPFQGTCDTSVCACGNGYEKEGTNCKVKPAVPTLTVSDGTALDALIIGGSYTLVCDSADSFGGLPYVYTFSQGSTDIPGGTLATVTQAADGATDYKCTATYDGISTDSADATIEVKPAQPTLAAADGTPLDDLSEGGTYTLVCTTSSTGSATYAYAKDGTSTSATLTGVSTASTAGDYTCTATIETIDSDASVAVTIAVGAAGTYCSDDGDCSGASYSGTCTNNRCVCATYYEATGTACTAVKPNTPTLSEQGGTPLTDLSTGGSYTLVCTSTDAPPGTTATFYRNNVDLGTAELANAASANDGSYTCENTANGATSDRSAAIDLEVRAAGTYCTANGDCSGTGHSGTCTSNRCVCATDYEASAQLCTPTGKSCTDGTDCVGDEFSGTCTASVCVCESGFELSAGGCEAKPATPVLTVTGANSEPESDLSEGATYTLTCTSSTSGTSSEFYKGTTLLDGASLASVSSSDEGTYSCIALTSGGVRSDESADITIQVGAPGKYCASNTDCTAGVLFTGTCTANRCVCTSGNQATDNTCSSAVRTATISMLSILLAFMVSKLL